ncbi:MAG: aldo/keto reductase [Gemmatimonadales bacterium]|jgi:aryl-alcohol dehydrogenase-like predicted oxidoreductase
MAPDKDMSRREFIQMSAAGLAAASAAGAIGGCSIGSSALPTRTLGATGMEISTLAFGGGSQFLLNEDGAWEPMLERAVGLGVNYFDTSSSYQWDAGMSSEERFGEVLSPIRDRLFIATKFDSRDPAGALSEFERSLQRMRTDYVDVLMIHSVVPADDIAVLERGVYAEMRRLKEEGSVRFIGFSSMDSAERSREAIEKLEFDVALLAMNPTGYGGFVAEVLPAARAKRVGVLAMKVMRDIVGESATPDELLRYALSQDGVASALVGHHGLATLEQNVEIVRALTGAADAGMAASERRHLESRLAGLAGPHALCWACPGYSDGAVSC